MNPDKPLRKLSAGDRVVHPTRKDWGNGKVLEEQRGDAVRVFFTGVGKKIIRLDLVALEVLQGESARDPLLDNLGNHTGAYRRISTVIEAFSHRYPGGFQGERYLGEERNYKWAAHLKVKAGLEEVELKKLMDAGEWQEAAKRIRSTLTNLLFTTEAIALNSILKEEESASAYLRSLFDLLYGREEMEHRFTRHAETLASLEAGKWTITTYFLFLRYPETYLFVKPEPTKNAAECAGFEIGYEPRVNWKTYHRVQAFGTYLEDQLRNAGLRPVDRIDVQSFMWCIAPDKPRPVQKGKKVVQRDFLRQLVKRFGMDESRLIREYAAAERRGEVPRKKNEAGLTPEDYAAALLRDALAKKWLVKESEP